MKPSQGPGINEDRASGYRHKIKLREVHVCPAEPENRDGICLPTETEEMLTIF